MSCQSTKVQIQLLHPDAVLPTKAHESDACFDVVAVSMEATEEYVQYGLGFSTAIPHGWQGLIYPRSSISKYNLALANSVAVIDADYRGEWLVRFRFTLKEVSVRSGDMRLSEIMAGRKVYKVGEIIAQIQFQRVPTITFETVDSLPDTVRGAGGFGSTGS